jgi:UDPglucose--hexose-1-phosphate uridylyltransferase
MPQLRQSIITGEWVVFAPERAKRPSDYISIATERKQKREDCNFCIDSPKSEYPKRLKNFDKNTTFILGNKFPAFVEDAEACNSKMYKVEDDFYKLKMSLGGHNLVVIKDHDQSLPKFTTEIWHDLFNSFKEQYKYFEDLCNVDYIMPIYNHGPESGASIEHPHAQIFASSIIPNIVHRELTHTANYYSDNKTCPFCDMVKHELEQNTRLLFQNDDFAAFTFYAARFPFEVWILPKHHESHFTAITSGQMENLVKICRQVFNRLDVVLNDPPVNFFLHSAPCDQKKKDLPNFHWHLEIAPRLSNYGGYEMGSGVIIDIINPEAAADYLRLGQQKKAKS